jgi:hypothetical protein
LCILVHIVYLRILLHTFKIRCFINKTILIHDFVIVKLAVIIDLGITQRSLRVWILKILCIHYAGVASVAITDSTLLSTSQYLFSYVRNHFFPLEINIV